MHTGEQVEIVSNSNILCLPISAGFFSTAQKPKTEKGFELRFHLCLRYLQKLKLSLEKSATENQLRLMLFIQAVRLNG